jgi:hypothetical protein
MKYLSEKKDEKQLLDSIKEMELQLVNSPNYSKKGSVSTYQMMAETYRFLDKTLKKEVELFGIS